MVIAATLTRRGHPPYVASHPDETLPTFGRAPYLPWQDSLATSLRVEVLRGGLGALCRCRHRRTGARPPAVPKTVPISSPNP